MISGDGWNLSFPDICLTVEEKRKLTRPGIEPGKDVTPRTQRWSRNVFYSLYVQSLKYIFNISSLSGRNTKNLFNYCHSRV